MTLEIIFSPQSFSLTPQAISHKHLETIFLDGGSENAPCTVEISCVALKLLYLFMKNS